MERFLGLPHRVCESTCYVNGLEDVLEWKGAKYQDYLLSVLGGMGEFTYLKIKAANPPEMVYWGANTKYLLKDLEKIIGFEQEISENRVFKNTFQKIKEMIDHNHPVVAGALDIYYLHYYKELYKKQHIPIHYILIIGYSDEKEEVYVQDCTFSQIQNVSYLELERALSVSVPGMSKKNTIRTFIFKDNPPSEYKITKRGLSLRAEKMLDPPVSIFGIPAMKKLAREIYSWEDEKSFDHLITYATIPPHLPKSFENSNGMRFWKADIFMDLGKRYGESSWVEASDLFKQSGNIIIDICKAAIRKDKKTISGLLMDIAIIEEQAYKKIAPGSS